MLCEDLTAYGVKYFELVILELYKMSLTILNVITNSYRLTVLIDVTDLWKRMV